MSYKYGPFPPLTSRMREWGVGYQVILPPVVVAVRHLDDNLLKSGKSFSPRQGIEPWSPA